ncbi:MAG: DJ-1/PfpI family protein [Gammaproteobacteria bacterium]|jgi:transcriptional regulator GlxA family with amidase domain|nr:DJ-1/PfpI family protein [Xanthomonadales bacterium]
MEHPNTKLNFAIYIYENVEVLDFAAPFEVFSTAGRFIETEKKPSVFLVAEQQTAVSARGGLGINPNYCISKHPDVDVLIIPGGIHNEEIKKQNVLDWIKEQSEQASLVASVCTGAFLLAEAKVLTNQKVTTHWEDIPELRENYPDLTVLENQRWIDQEKFITSAGISAGIDMSLYIVGQIYGINIAEKTAKQMEYDWIKTS